MNEQDKLAKTRIQAQLDDLDRLNELSAMSPVSKAVQ